MRGYDAHWLCCTRWIFVLSRICTVEQPVLFRGKNPRDRVAERICLFYLNYMQRGLILCHLKQGVAAQHSLLCLPTFCTGALRGGLDCCLGPVRCDPVAHTGFEDVRVVGQCLRATHRPRNDPSIVVRWCTLDGKDC